LGVAVRLLCASLDFDALQPPANAGSSHHQTCFSRREKQVSRKGSWELVSGCSAPLSRSTSMLCSQQQKVAITIRLEKQLPLKPTGCTTQQTCVCKLVFADRLLCTSHDFDALQPLANAGCSHHHTCLNHYQTSSRAYQLRLHHHCTYRIHLYSVLVVITTQRIQLL
jgi:hypothetical protein